MLLTVSNLKGGVGKTTTAVNVALGLAEQGRTLLVDADPQRSATRWAELAQPWPVDRCTVVSWAEPKSLRKRIETSAGQYDHIVVDVPPHGDDMLTAALEATGNLVVPTSTSAHDLAEISATFSVASAVDARRVVLASVLLVRTRSGTRSVADAREVLTDDFGYPVMRAQIPLRESIAQSFGLIPSARDRAPYGDALAEILANHGK